MLEFPAYMTQYPSSTKTIPTLFLLPSQWPQPHNDELLLALEESDFEDKCNEIRKMNNNLIVIGKTTNENDKEDFDNEADDDDVDNAEEFEGMTKLKFKPTYNPYTQLMDAHITDSDWETSSDSSSSEDQEDADFRYGGQAWSILSSLEESIGRIDDFFSFERAFVHRDVVCSLSDPSG
ncbi:hypothetical protein RJT34_11718 [Clitoria ternatea]|uniref:Uncharacterized protein n=1 Tax=Clitoria ternatea TaxID=43366 RepID=A0AAN9JKK7_CLITE